MRREHATGEHWWVVTGSDAVLGLVTECRRQKDALRLATAFFPDLEGALSVRPWMAAPAREKSESQQAFRITPPLCERMELQAPQRTPNELPETLSIHTAVDQLRRRFSRPVAAGSGR